MLPVEGQNSGRVERMVVSGQEFEAYVERHRAEARAERLWLAMRLWLALETQCVRA